MGLTFENIINVDEHLVELVRNWRNSEIINQYMITNHYISKEEHRQWLTNLKTKKNAKVWIIKYNDTPVGAVYLSQINYQKKSTEWGFYIADESIRGKGIGSTTLYKLMEYVFDTLQFQRMNTLVLENNVIAIKMYEKFGFTKDNRKKQYLTRQGRQFSIFSMMISREKWKNIHTTLKCLQADNLF